eukprot:CAMPEP_0115570218 /NCGR_PEP_ID=MMETSP0271-20121206/105590_1 /TAXON_ID=71861 /ORGANISM="Scrippsiella trochoidea, Strain CCMP3099" /LENGTH=493 /DNA_ID=CAMNT_0003004757 /DNA_START=48 /DNA_END=1531 /DNA_ORIENTATION=+
MGQTACTQVSCQKFKDGDTTLDLVDLHRLHPNRGSEVLEPATYRWSPRAHGHSGPVLTSSSSISGPIYSTIHPSSQDCSLENGLQGLGLGAMSGVLGSQVGQSKGPAQRSERAPQHHGAVRAAYVRGPPGELSSLSSPTRLDGGEVGLDRRQLQRLSGSLQNLRTQLSHLEDLPPAEEKEEALPCALAVTGAVTSGQEKTAQTLLRAKLPLRFDELKFTRSASYLSSGCDSTLSHSDDDSDVGTEAGEMCGACSSQEWDNAELGSAPVSDKLLAEDTAATLAKQSVVAEKTKLPGLLFSKWKGSANKTKETDKAKESQEDPSSMMTPQDKLLVQKIRDTREAQQNVRAFLKSHGFRGVCAKKRRLTGFTFPLHTSVSQNDAAMVLALLKAGADPRQTDSSGRTPYQLALSLENGRGSHRDVLRTLSKAGAAVSFEAVLIRSSSAPPTPSCVPVSQGMLAQVQVLLTLDGQTITEFSFTALSAAALSRIRLRAV